MILTDSGSSPYDISNDIMKCAKLKFQYDISGTGRPIDFVFDSRCPLSSASEPHRLSACYVMLTTCILVNPVV